MGKAKRVALVTISEDIEPRSIVTNTCENRTFLTGVVKELDRLGAKVIAIDQSYSQGSCDNDTVNNLFRTTLQQAKAPIVVGQRAHVRTDEISNADCLIMDPEFNFMPSGSSVTDGSKNNVHVGLLRLNSNSLKIPLSWNIFPDDASSEDKQSSEISVDGFAYVAAKQADPRVAENWKVLKFKDEGEHPYASFVSSFPTWSAMDLLCNGPDKLASQRPGGEECEKIAHIPFHLTGKVVVVGERINSDLKPFPRGDQFGMDLHASYVESLLEKRYLSTAPRLLDDGSVYLFVLLGIILEALSIRRPKITQTAITVLMSFLFLFLILIAIVLLQRDLYMPHLLLASVSMAVTLVGYGATAVMSELSNRHKRTGV
jgi:hypothetical protein